MSVIVKKWNICVVLRISGFDCFFLDLFSKNSLRTINASNTIFALLEFDAFLLDSCYSGSFKPIHFSFLVVSLCFLIEKRTLFPN